MSKKVSGCAKNAQLARINGMSIDIEQTERNKLRSLLFKQVLVLVANVEGCKS